MTGPVGILFGESKGNVLLENISLSNASIIPDERLLTAISVGGLGGKLSAHPDEPWENDTVTFRQIKLQNITFGCNLDRTFQNSGGLFGIGGANINYAIQQVSADGIKAVGCAGITRSGFLAGIVQSNSQYVKTMEASIQNIDVQNSIFSANELEYVATFGQIAGDHTTYNLDMQNISLKNNTIYANNYFWEIGWLVGNLNFLANKTSQANLQKISASNNHMQINCGHYGGLIGSLGMNENDKQTFIMSELDLQSNSMSGNYVCGTGFAPGGIGFLIGSFTPISGVDSTSIISNAKIQNSTIQYEGTEGLVNYVGFGFGFVSTRDNDNILFENIYAIDNRMHITSRDILDIGGLFGLVSDYNDQNVALTIKHSASIGSIINLFGESVSNVGGLVGDLRSKITEAFSMPSENGGGIYIQATDSISDVGGFAGYILDGTVEDSYTLLPISIIAYEVDSIGGFNGYASSGSVINRTYAVSEFSFNSLNSRCIGEFVGDAGTIDSSFWLDSTTDPSPLPGVGCIGSDYVWVKALSGPEFLLGITFSMYGWDIGSDDTIWNINDGQSLPYLNFKPIPVGPGNYAESYAIQQLRDK